MRAMSVFDGRSPASRPLVAATMPDRLAGAAINDIGPVVDPNGIERIASYVGQSRSFETWMHAARALQETGDTTFPAYSLEDWLRMAKRAMRVHGNGRIAVDYDLKIAQPFAQPDNAVPPDLWPAYEALAEVPLLVLRGELSDLLSPATLEAMAERTPEAEFVTVPGVGHAPMLDEPDARAAIDRLLERIA